MSPVFRQAVMAISDGAATGDGFVSQESDMETDTETISGENPDVTSLGEDLEATVIQEDSALVEETEQEESQGETWGGRYCGSIID